MILTCRRKSQQQFECRYIYTTSRASKEVDFLCRLQTEHSVGLRLFDCQHALSFVRGIQFWRIQPFFASLHYADSKQRAYHGRTWHQHDSEWHPNDYSWSQFRDFLDGNRIHYPKNFGSTGNRSESRGLESNFRPFALWCSSGCNCSSCQQSLTTVAPLNS